MTVLEVRCWVLFEACLLAMGGNFAIVPAPLTQL